MTSIALIADIVGSRDLDDRAAAQAAVVDAFRAAERRIPPELPLWATVGDEFQAVFGDIGSAVRATTIARLLLPDGMECRFGLGEGDRRDIPSATGGVIQDGSAWIHAREAIDEAHRREDRANPYLRSWFVSGGDDAAINSLLLLRDHAITGMGARERRLAAGALLGRPQSELARQEGVSQSAVSQSLRRSGGAALLAADQLFEEVPR